MIETLAKATLANPSYRVVSTGHSKGGAVAAIAAAALRNMGYIVDLASTANSNNRDCTNIKLSTHMVNLALVEKKYRLI